MTDIQIETRVEIAPGADLTAVPSSWPWVDITRRQVAGSRTTVYQQSFSLKRGAGNEAERAQPASIGFTVDNPDGAITPDHPMSVWWPDIKQGMPCRVSVRQDGLPRHLALPGVTGAYASTPDAASLDITGDIWLAAEFTPDRWFQPLAQTLVGKWRETGNQRSYMLQIDANGRPRIITSPDGTIPNQVIVTASVGVPQPMAGPVAIGVQLDVNNGASGRTARFYVAPSRLGPWEPLGDPVIQAGTTSIFAGTAPLEVGSRTDGTLELLAGSLRWAEVRSAPTIGTPATGTVVANPNFTIQDVGDSSFADTAAVPKTWTINGTAEITDWRTRFVGHIDELNPRWPSGNLPGNTEVEISASGFLRRMQQGAKPIQSTLRRKIGSPQLASFITAYWPCEDGSGASRIASPIPGVPTIKFGSNLRPGSDSTLAASEALPSVSSGLVGYVSGQIRGGSSTQWAVELLCRIPTPETDPASTRILTVDSLGTARQWRVFINSTVLRVIAVDGDGVEVENNATVLGPEVFDHWFLFRLNATQSGGNIAWGWTIVPIPEIGFSPGGGGTADSFAGTLGRVTAVGNFVTAPPDGFSFGHIVVQSGLNLGWLAGADTAWGGETAAHRFYRLCIEEQIPGSIVGDNTVTQFSRGNPELSEVMGPQRPALLLDLLQECADTDLGMMTERRSTGLAFRTRQSLYNQTPRLELDYSQGHVIEPFRPTSDDQRKRNDVTVTRPGGSSARATTDPPPPPADLYEDDPEVNVLLDEQLKQQAAWRLHLGTAPGMRYPGISPELAFQQQLIDDWLDAGEGDLVRVTNLPPEHPPGDVDLLIEGSDDNWSQQGWAPQLNCGPGAPWQVGVLDGDGTPDTDLARLDDDTTTLGAPIDADDTGIATSTAFGAVWTADADYYPMLLDIGGEIIRANGATNFFGVHTFSPCDRSVNGVVKSHPAGVPVHVAQPIRLSL
jgi:hypothetical protein